LPALSELLPFAAQESQLKGVQFLGEDGLVVLIEKEHIFYEFQFVSFDGMRNDVFIKVAAVLGCYYRRNLLFLHIERYPEDVCVELPSDSSFLPQKVIYIL